MKSLTHPSLVLVGRMQRGKAERKAAAVERSKRRQKDQTYFEGKKMANTQPEVCVQIKMKSARRTGTLAVQ